MFKSVYLKTTEEKNIVIIATMQLIHLNQTFCLISLYAAALGKENKVKKQSYVAKDPTASNRRNGIPFVTKAGDAGSSGILSHWLPGGPNDQKGLWWNGEWCRLVVPRHVLSISFQRKAPLIFGRPYFGIWMEKRLYEVE